LTLADRHGELAAAAALRRGPGRRLEAASDEYSEDWDLLARDQSARAHMWERVALLSATRLEFPGLPVASAQPAASALTDAGYRVAATTQQRAPYLELPPSWEELLGTISRNRRSKVRRYRKRLEQEGRVAFRTTRGGAGLDADLGRFFEVEGSGWKGAAGSALRARPETIALYTEFAHAAAANEWLRLHFLELDGSTIASAYCCAIGPTTSLLKSGFDERYRALVPGSALRAEVLRAAIDEGATRFEFMGGEDEHKLQWNPRLRERVLVRGYRGAHVAEYLYRHRVRRAAAWSRDLLRRSRRN
jgi:CelD/BcsL family acetyltransferase involved in cellulose biosynthesis